MTAILICADAQPSIGTGHLRRMVTLAEALEDIAAVDIVFQTSQLGADILASAGHQWTTYVAPCTPTSIRDRLWKGRFDVAILDNYHWSAKTVGPFRNAVPILMVVDDLADRVHDADILLDQNANHSAGDYDGLVPDTCVRLVGGQYCLLSKAFRQAPDHGNSVDDQQIFVSLGGGDPKNDLLPLTKALIKRTPFRLSIATGGHIADAAKLAAFTKDHPKRIELVFDSKSVPEQMRHSRIAVAAGGTMTWERAAIGLPSISLILADNQVDTSNWLQMKGLHETFDLRTDWDPKALAKAVNDLMADETRQLRYARNSRQLVVPDGAVRVAERLLKKVAEHTG